MKRRIGALLTVAIFSCMCMTAAASPSTGRAQTLDETLVKGLKFRHIGPALTSGRIADIAVHPHNPHTWYVAVGSGGVWKTRNRGTTWTPLFDGETSYSIGCVSLDPRDPDRVWVGSGENVSGRHVGFGDGVYRSDNGGETWQNMGLGETEHIAEILVDPRDSDVVYVAAEGPLWAAGGQRGVFKSSDRGRTWRPCLQIDPHTGVTSLVFEPGNPDVLYAAAYQRRRTVAAFMAGGPSSGIYKSDDAGKNWKKLSLGLPKGDMGRIGLAVSTLKPNVVYATVEAGSKEKGFYRSENRGESWQKRSSFTSGGTGSHYYQEIFADPHRFDRVYQVDVWLRVTDDGGKTFRKVPTQNKHSDNHALAFSPSDPDVLVAGTDGGVYESCDAGQTWRYMANLPVTQFYKMALDNALPFYNVVGGAQDNGTLMGPSRTSNINGIMNRDWFFVGGADGYGCAVDPGDDNLLYVSWQVGGLLRLDKAGGEKVNIQPQPAPGEDAPRWNWDAPLLLSPHAAGRIYYGSQRLYRSDDRGDNWTAVSPDLSRGIFRLAQPVMGRTWDADSLWDHDAMSYYGNLTAIAESPLREGLLYVGTDDGLIQVSEDGGKHWRKIESLRGVPKHFFTNDIKACLHREGTVFAALDNHKSGDFKPYLLKSTDRGRTWTSIAGNLPHRHLVWTVEQDHKNPDLLFVGTEFGIFFTLDCGGRWVKLNGGLPTISFRDIQVQRRENDLVAASFGRGFYILDDYSPLRHLTAAALEREAVLFPVKKALAYTPSRPFDLKGKGFQGDDFFLAPNPPFGAIFTYYLRDGLEEPSTPRDKPGTFAGWDALKRRDRRKPPVLILTVEDDAGRVVRRITGPTGKGIHRVAWDLHYAASSPTRLEPPRDPAPWEEPPRGPKVIPGRFTVSLARRVDGVTTPLGQEQTFVVEAVGPQTSTAQDRREALGFHLEVSRLLRAVLGASRAVDEALTQLRFMTAALVDTPGAEPKLAAEIYELEQKLRDTLDKLRGDRTRGKRSEPRPPSLLDRIRLQGNGEAGIPGADRHNYRIAAREFEVLSVEIKKLIEVELKRLKEKLEAAGAPWTPGRGVPGWKEDK